MSGILKLLPKLERARRIRLQEHQVLITVVGFEDRRLAATNILTGTVGGKVVVLTYRSRDLRNDFEGFARALRRKGLSVRNSNIVEYDSFNPHAFPAALKRCSSVRAAKHVILDISAMSKLAFLLCMDVCRELNVNVSVHYAEALDYGPSKEEYEKAKNDHSIHRPSMQIYTGVRGVIRVSRFSSVAMQGQPTAAIAFMSFNEELIQALLDCVYPARLFLINGKPPTLKWREEATAWIHEQLLKEWPQYDNPIHGGLPTRTASTLDYRDSFGILRALYWRLTIDHRILLAPTGSKMQALGCFLVAALHPDIHIEYPTPQGFLNLYSKGIGDQWIVNFGRLGDLIGKLNVFEKKDRLDVRPNQQQLCES